MKPFKWNIWCCSFHETKAKKQGKKKQQKKTRTKRGQENKEKNKKQERERPRVKRKSERNQGERKGDTEKWTKITLFQGKNSGCKKPRENKKNEKTRKPSAPQPQGHFWLRPAWEIQEKTRHARAPTARQICARAGQNAKNALLKNTPKKLSSKMVRKIEPFRHVKRGRSGRKTQNRSETPSFVAFRVCTPLGLSCQKAEEHERKKNLREGWPEKCAKSLQNGPFAKPPTENSAKCRPPISRYKWFQKTRSAY